MTKRKGPKSMFTPVGNPNECMTQGQYREKMKNRTRPLHETKIPLHGGGNIQVEKLT